ncbi:MAG: hypothetical protein AB1458_00445 [Bacteroidota bacterium]
MQKASLNRKDFEQLSGSLQAICKSKEEATLICFFDFLFWAESKAEGRAFAEVVNKKARKTGT